MILLPADHRRNKKGPVSGACCISLQREETPDVSLNILYISAISSAFATDQHLARSMLKHIMLCFSLQNKAMLFGKFKHFTPVVFNCH
jgi:hypothetical protein